MRNRAAIWIAFADVMLCLLAIVIGAVNPKAAEVADNKAEYFLSIEWDVNVDADADIWLDPPLRTPVFYAVGSRQVGCARLDSDNKGFQDAFFKGADGSEIKLESDKETISLRCIEPGHYDLAVNLYAYRDGNGFNKLDDKALGLRVHVEIEKVNPSRHLVFSKNVTLDRILQTINVVSFDLDASGEIAFSKDVPIKSVVDAYYLQHPPVGMEGIHP